MSTLRSYCPVTLDEAGEVDTTEVDDICGIVDESRKVQMEWKDVPKKEKATLLRSLRLLLAEKAEDIAHTTYLETGKPRADAFNTEVMTSAIMTKQCEQWVRKFKNKQKVDMGEAKLLTFFLGRRSVIEYRPLGVIAIISPYNFPFSIPFTETVTAVAAGNSVILKPSSETPLCGALIEKLFLDAGFPEGLVRAVHGPGTGAGLSCQNVDRIVFTGSTSVGKEIMRTASENLIPVTLELGGKDAMIVFDDADMDRTLAGAVWGSFVNSGQVCVGVKRIFVHRTVYDEFVKEFVSRTNELKQGDGWNDPEVSVGPMINACELRNMERICAEAVEQGGTIHTGGRRNPDLEGHFFLPTVITGLSNDSDIVQNEIFGPIVTIFPFDDEDDAVKMANNSPFGLGGSVWTTDLRKGERVASRICTGTVDVNNTSYTFGLPATPWGGRKQSGFGTTHSIIGFMDVMFPHHIHTDKARFPRDPWWMPYDAGKTEAQENMIDPLFGTGKGKIGLIRRLLPILKNKR